MLSKEQRKKIAQLAQKKHRQDRGLFVAEGEKVVRDLLNSKFRFALLLATQEIKGIPATIIDKWTMKNITQLKTPSPVLGVFHIPKEISVVDADVIVAVDALSDPGNLGTIIRLCDWFGVSQLVCGQNTVDCFNPKTVQASMGSIARVGCIYVNLVSFLSQTDKTVYSASLTGQSIYKTCLDKKGIFVFGSESHGISSKTASCIHKKLTIPSNKAGAESLNVSIAAAIFLSEIFRG